MRAVQIDRHGGPDVLDLREIPDPELAPGQVLVRTVASSINPVDWKTRAWDRGPAFPMTLGWDLAGVVVASTVSTFAPGARVLAMSNQLATGRGTWADLVALPADLLARAPRSVSLAEAATLPLAGMTALHALRTMRLESGVRVLVVGAAGAVGTVFTQLAMRAGATVDALVSRSVQVGPATELGAELVTADWADLPSGSYQIVFDTAGLERSGVQVGALLAAGGEYVSITDDPLPALASARTVQVSEDGGGLAALARQVDDGKVVLEF
jgi:NADPH:quinone reductase-like Zn-dependent oxidoreductase